jgi:two-component system, OmpR family, response regulator
MDSAAHVLFVEDDPEIRGLVADFLRQSGFRATVAQDGEEMDRVMTTDGVDLLILDIMLPKEDGLSLCRRVRASGNLPVIMLTARGSEIDRVVGLEIGADDYLTKPFSSNELVARIRALLRRSQYAPLKPRSRRSILTFADWRLDLVARRLHSRDGTRVPLTSGEFELLLAFCEHANRVLTRDQLLDYTHGKIPAAVVDRSIDIQVSRLRRKIEKDPKDPVLIQTVRSGGYVFAAEVALE